MTGSVNNGRRADVAFGPYQRRAGIVEQANGTMRIAFFGAADRLKGEKTGTVDGAPVAVLSVDTSDPGKGGVAGMVVVTAVTL